MPTLAIDCSRRWLNLGLADSGALYGEENINAGRAQAELLPGTVGSFLTKLGFGLRDVTRIAVTTGPGYYTGIRIGLSYAAALAEALGVEIVPVSSLYAMAFPFLGAGFWAAPAIRARRGCLYGAIYPPGDGKIFEPEFQEATSFAELINSLVTAGGNVVIIGSDAEEFEELRKPGFWMVPSPPATGLALAMASFGLFGQDPAHIRATYAREPT
ncbi:MAG: tRNA (adenosine(37)-N6)-threonylcarbamoyltransferase complex dimerization subunit type 1 TsaB [Synergistaceae bacterium]|jgi:tRNA threonylcarbamoyladenosine biosynthesis protein TsaB|nr:tRNA (adenosine(37)-N6)-threonylcarbamoyltransferase complex dimerization subunit type 1 TsaB [Synergistaceae bacterium]